MNFYIITGVINAALALLFGFFVVIKRKTYVNNIFFLFCLSVAVWSIFYVLWLMSVNISQALFFSRMLMVGAIFIPITYLHFVLVLTKKTKEKKHILIFGYSIFTIFLLFTFSSLFVESVTPKMSFPFWPNPGILYHPFIVMWIVYAFYGIYFLWNEFKKALGNKKLQLRYILIGTIIGYLGGITNYLLWYDIPITPVGNWTFSVYLAFIFYSIIRYRFLDIRVAAGKFFVYFFTIFTVSLFAYFLHFLGILVNVSFTLQIILAVVISVLLFNPLLYFFERLASKYFYYSFYSSQKTLNNMGKKLTQILDLRELTELITSTLKETIKLNRVVILLWNKNNNKFHVEKNIGFKEDNGISLLRDNFLTEWLKKNRKILVYEELSLMLRENIDKNEKEKIEELQKNMEKIEASLCIPLISKNNLIGIIVLGEKISKDPYSKQDIDLLDSLFGQFSISLQNAKLYSEVEDLYQNLEKRVEEQTKELKSAYEELKASDLAKSEFTNMASHQLRTPLTSLKGYTSMLREGNYGKIPAKAKEKLDVLYESIERLIHLVNKLLNISRVDLGKLSTDMKEQDIVKVVKSSFMEMEGEAEEKRLSTKLKLPKKEIILKFDFFQIREVVTELIDNAIKYTNKGNVTVGLKEEETQVIIYVSDTGEGLAKNEDKRIFERFSRGEAGIASFTEGTGLGLHLIKEYMNLHNGKIWVESKGKGKGSTFYIEFKK